jgi:biotin carboxylase/SAM-dependent methyltransferase
MIRDTWLIAVGAGRWQLPGIEAARAAGLKVLAVDGDAQALGFQLADQSLTVDIRDASEVIAAIERTGIQPAGAIAFCNEAGMLTTAALREHFQLPCARGEVTRALTNKGVQRAQWTAAKLPCPLWFVVHAADEVPAVLAQINGTTIFKPVDSAGSRGVTVVAKDEPWQAAFEAALKGSLSKEVIIESFIVGIEHTVETFTHRGQTQVLAVTEKKKVPGTSNTVAYELASAQLAPAKRAEADTIVTKALAALGYTEGPGHTEFLLTASGEIYLVESAGRGGGFMVADGIVPQTSGFDLTRACALQAVGHEPDAPPAIKPRAVVLRFVPSRMGKVVAMHGFAAQDEMPGVQCQAMVHLGQEVGRAASDGDRMAFILATADTIAEAMALTDAREQRITFTMTLNDLPVHELEYADRICECCGSAETEMLWHFDHYTRTQSGYWAFRMGNAICAGCGMVYVPRSPTPQTLEPYYQDTYPAGALSMPTYRPEVRVKTIQRHAPQARRVVDVGSSREEDFHRQLKGLGMEVLRMDIKGHAMTDTGSLAAIAPESADVVTHYFVLEHVPQIHAFLADCRGILKPGGIMVIEVPYIRSYKKDWLGILPHEHVNHWSAGCLSAVVSQCGFEVLEHGLEISSRNPVGFALVCRKTDSAKPLPVPVDEYAENRRCFMAGVENVRAFQARLRELHLAAQAELNNSGRVLLWCANDLMHRFFLAGGALQGEFMRVDSSPNKRDFFGPGTVMLPQEAAEFIPTATLLLVFSDLNAPAIVKSIADTFGKVFDDANVLRPEIHRIC